MGQATQEIYFMLQQWHATSISQLVDPWAQSRASCSDSWLQIFDISIFRLLPGKLPCASFRGIHGFLGTLHCFQLPSQPGQPARTGLSCHVKGHSFLGHLSIFQAFETRIQSENPIPNKLGIRGIWQTISQSNFVARSFLGRQLGWRWKHGKSHSFVVFFSYSSPEACVALWWRDWGWRPPTIQSSIATCPASGPFSACGLRWHCNMHWDV